MFDYIKDLERKYRVSIHACCLPQLPTSKCIDVEKLMRLHDEGELISLKEIVSENLPKNDCFPGGIELAGVAAVIYLPES